MKEFLLILTLITSRGPEVTTVELVDHQTCDMAAKMWLIDVEDMKQRMHGHVSVIGRAACVYIGGKK